MIFKTWVIAILFLTQITFAFVVHPIMGWNDVFPLFHWRLFARVYKKRNLPLLLIKEADGTKFVTPILFYDFYSARGKSFMTSMSQDLHQILLTHYEEPHLLQQKINMFEKKYFLGQTNVVYQIADATIDIKDFYEKKMISDLKVIYENSPNK